MKKVAKLHYKQGTKESGDRGEEGLTASQRRVKVGNIPSDESEEKNPFDGMWKDREENKGCCFPCA